MLGYLISPAARGAVVYVVVSAAFASSVALRASVGDDAVAMAEAVLELASKVAAVAAVADKTLFSTSLVNILGPPIPTRIAPTNVASAKVGLGSCCTENGYIVACANAP